MACSSGKILMALAGKSKIILQALYCAIYIKPLQCEVIGGLNNPSNMLIHAINQGVTL